MIAISAVDKNWAIGNQGHLLISLPEDQKGVFKKYTAGHTVVFGRKISPASGSANWWCWRKWESCNKFIQG